MKVVILAGGLGTRLGEETTLRPKPLVEVGGLPIIWHIMKYYSSFGYNEFIVCLGYKGYMIKEFFMNYMAHLSDLTIDFSSNETQYNYSRHAKEPWKVHLVHTGDTNMTGSRIKQIKSYIGNDKSFFLTYGDGVSNLDITEEVRFHESHGKIGTMLAIQPPGRFGVLDIKDSAICNFIEKPQGDGNYINGGYFILNKEIFDYLDNSPNLIFEQQPLQQLAQDNQLQAFKHNGFWQCMDTLRDKQTLETLWESGDAPWKR